MSTPYETIEVTPSLRLQLYSDADSPNPREDWDGILTGYAEDRHHWTHRVLPTPLHAFPGPLDDALHHDDWDIETVQRWARIFYGAELVRSEVYGGVWFIDRAGFVENFPELDYGSHEGRLKQREIIADEVETYRKWADGELFMLVLERAHAMAPVVWNAASEVWDLRNPLTEHDITYSWDPEDSIGGNYPDDTYPPAAIALDLDITEDEHEALLQLLPAEMAAAVRAEQERRRQQ